MFLNIRDIKSIEITHEDHYADEPVVTVANWGFWCGCEAGTNIITGEHHWSPYICDKHDKHNPNPLCRDPENCSGGNCKRDPNCFD